MITCIARKSHIEKNKVLISVVWKKQDPPDRESIKTLADQATCNVNMPRKMIIRVEEPTWLNNNTYANQDIYRTFRSKKLTKS